MRQDPKQQTSGESALVQAGRLAWASLGVAGVALVLVLALREVSVVIVPLVVALFPAAVLSPLATVLRKRGVPGAAVALLLIGGLLGLVGLGAWFVAPRFAEQVPELVRSVQQALSNVEQWLQDGPAAIPVDVDERGLGAVAERAFDGGAQDAFSQGVGLARGLVDVVTGVLLFLVALFFYLRDGERIWAGITSLLPGTAKRHVDAVSGQLWWTVGAYFRGQIAVAVVDAVAIGAGLAVLGVPLVVPLALLVFAGGFFPIVGAFVTGLLAVLVALAAEGPVTALLVLALVVVVQQAEGNLLEPLILSPVLALHPMLIITAVTVGAVTAGVLGAFLAVPLAACAGRVVDYARGRPPAAGPGSDADTGHSGWSGPHDDPPRRPDADEDAADADHAEPAERQESR